MLQCDMGYLKNTQLVFKEALGNQRIFFTLIFRPVYYTQGGHDLDLCYGVERGLPHPELLDGSEYFGGSQGRRRQQVIIVSTSDS